jgi:hypothetical protein
MYRGSDGQLTSSLQKNKEKSFRRNIHADSWPVVATSDGNWLRLWELILCKLIVVAKEVYERRA